MTIEMIAVVHGLRRGGAHRRLTETLSYVETPYQEFILSDADPFTSTPIVVRVWNLADRLPAFVRPPLRYLDFVQRRVAYKLLSRKIRKWQPSVVFMNPCHLFKSPALEPKLLQMSVLWLDELPKSLEIEALKKTTRPSTRLIYGPLRALLRRNNRVVIGNAAVVLTSSNYMADLMMKVYRRKVIPEKCGVSRDFTDNPEATRQSYVISVGSLIPGKGHDLALEGIGKSGLNLSLVIVTHRPVETEIERLRSVADRMGVDVTFRFGITDGELAALYQSAAFTSYLSTLEPFGLVSIESQACGTPALVSQEGGLPETIVNGVTGRSVERNVDLVADAMLEVFEWSKQPTTRVACRDFGQSWQWSLTASSVLAHLENVAS
jgi:glycosyltransferase involved in cell wall biosynthesis